MGLLGSSIDGDVALVRGGRGWVLMTHHSSGLFVAGSVDHPMHTRHPERRGVQTVTDPPSGAASTADEARHDHPPRHAQRRLRHRHPAAHASRSRGSSDGGIHVSRLIDRIADSCPGFRRLKEIHQTLPHDLPHSIRARIHGGLGQHFTTSSEASTSPTTVTRALSSSKAMHGTCSQNSQAAPSTSLCWTRPA